VERVIASGRASEILDLGDGRVLRRFTTSGSPEREALVMDHAARHGYPVPRVVEVLGDALVLERIEGPTMLQRLWWRPWEIPQAAGLLADLHKRLHEIEAPPELPDAGPGDQLLHLDLHPENVMLSPAGPVVIDWTNARRGAPALDAAMTWVILATSGGWRGRRFLRSFLACFDRGELERALPIAAARRSADPHVTDEEREAVARLVRENTKGPDLPA
jgi:aminoglycoside phosphotransferase (APT) family kinase protein